MNEAYIPTEGEAAKTSDVATIQTNEVSVSNEHKQSNVDKDETNVDASELYDPLNESNADDHRNCTIP